MMLLTIILNNIQANKEINKVKYSQGKSEKNQPLQQMVNIPSDRNDVQRKPIQAWNCNKIGFDPNGKLHNIICTYKFLPVELMCNLKTGDQSLFG